MCALYNPIICFKPIEAVEGVVCSQVSHAFPINFHIKTTPWNDLCFFLLQKREIFVKYFFVKYDHTYIQVHKSWLAYRTKNSCYCGVFYYYMNVSTGWYYCLFLLSFYFDVKLLFMFAEDDMERPIYTMGSLAIGRVTSLRDENFNRYAFEDSTIRIRTIVVARSANGSRLTDSEIYWTEVRTKFHFCYLLTYSYVLVR